MEKLSSSKIRVLEEVGGRTDSQTNSLTGGNQACLLPKNLTPGVTGSATRNYVLCGNAEVA